MAFEGNSWKHTYRKNSGKSIEDDMLTWFLNSTNFSNNRSKNLKRKAKSIGLDNQPIAFALVLEYKGKVYVAKTSYVDNKFRKLGLGVLVNDFAVKNIFDNRYPRQIDFLTNLPFVRKWGTTAFPRVRISTGGRVIFALQKLKTSARLTTSCSKGEKRS